MKALKLIIIGILLFFASGLKAQVSVSVNIGSPPGWGPTGYSGVRYYYLPDVEAYYDIQSSMFIYYEGRGWVHRAYLPERYRIYNLYGGYKVVMRDYRGNAPYSNFKEYKTKYARGYRGNAQRTIRDKPGRGNSEAKMNSNGHSNKNESRGNNKVRYGNDRVNSHGNGKNNKEDKGHDNGNGKK